MTNFVSEKEPRLTKLSFTKAPHNSNFHHFEEIRHLVYKQLKVGKSRKKYGVLDSSKKRTKLTILSPEDVQDSKDVFKTCMGR